MWFKRCCNENLLKIVKNWTSHHFWRAKDVTVKFGKVVLYLHKSLGNELSQLLAYVVPKLCNGIAYWFHRKCFEIKLLRLFLSSSWEFSVTVLITVDGIFSSKVIILPNNCENYFNFRSYGRSIITWRIGAGWVSVIFVMLRDGKQRGWVVLHERS